MPHAVGHEPLQQRGTSAVVAGQLDACSCGCSTWTSRISGIAADEARQPAAGSPLKRISTMPLRWMLAVDLVDRAVHQQLARAR